MDVCISHLNYWQSDSDICEHASKTIAKNEWPKLDFVPAMQRRRLSPFAKIALFVANQTSANVDKHLPIIFSSRHGDLHRTSELLADIVDETPLSPTAFGLSVHNAIPSLYSILTKNKEAINAISAGKDSLLMAIIDAYSRIKTGVADNVLIIHADQKLPDVYDSFKDEQQISHAVSFIVSLPTTNHLNEPIVSIEFEACLSKQGDQMPLALVFSKWMQSSSKQLAVNSDHYLWTLNKNVSTN